MQKVDQIRNVVPYLSPYHFSLGYLVYPNLMGDYRVFDISSSSSATSLTFDWAADTTYNIILLTTSATLSTTSGSNNGFGSNVDVTNDANKVKFEISKIPTLF